MRGWQGAMIRSQITPVLFSSYVWLLVAAFSPLAALLLLVAVCVALVLGWSTRPMLWVRFGVRRASAWERSQVLAAVAPMASMRGRGEPTVWLTGALPGVECLMPTPHDLVVSRRMFAQLASHQLGDEQACALVAHAKGLTSVWSSRLAAVLGVYTIPWIPLAVIGGVVGALGSRSAVLRAGWALRWVVFGVAIVQQAMEGRWWLSVLVAGVLVLTWASGFWGRRWQATLSRLGDEQVRAEGFGETLADMIRQARPGNDGLERADRLDSASVRL